MPLIGDQPLEQLLLERGRKAVQRDDVFAHVRVDPQRDACARARRRRRTSRAEPARRSRRRARPRSAVPGSFLRASLRGARSRGTILAPRARRAAHGPVLPASASAVGPVELCRWQIATASASATSCGDGARLEAEQQLHHLLDLRFLRAAVADHRALDLGGRVFVHRQPGFRCGQQRDAARVPQLQRAAHVARVKDALDGDAVGPAARRAARRGRRECAAVSRGTSPWRARTAIRKGRDGAGCRDRSTQP